MTKRPSSGFDSARLIGTVCEVSANIARANLPNASRSSPVWHLGNRVGGGEVGEFVVVESGEYAIFGRINNVRIPERERLTVEPRLGTEKEPNPVGEIQLLATGNFLNGHVVAGVQRHPRLGERVFSAHPDIVAWFTRGTPDDDVVSMRMARTSGSEVDIDVVPEKLFGRHCAVVGSTGGGKSWTVAGLIEQACTHRAKVILLDATGEFRTLSCGVTHVHIGRTATPDPDSEEVSAPYSQLTENDIFALFKPSGQSQAPKLRAAIKTLKLLRCEPSLGSGGVLKKANSLRAPFGDAYRKHSAFVESSVADFDITKLARQIELECVFTNDRKDPLRYGDPSENERSYCIGLINRVDEVVNAPEMACVMNPGTSKSITDVIGQFIEGSKRLLRISLEHVSFAHNAREIVSNAIGRRLLAISREGAFQQSPVVVFVDEAHQFFGKTLRDEFSRFELDAFELIAKEGRKYSLTVVLSTQRPRDIAEGVLSQMGTFVVHRLINDKDRAVIERASNELDESASAMIPSLSPGEAVVIGVDFPIPLVLRMRTPAQPPDSRGPDYQTYWRNI